MGDGVPETAWIEPALEAFDLSGSTAVQVGHIGFDSWMTQKFCVSSPSGDRWLLSLNEPRKESPDDVTRKLRSHLYWLQALDSDTDLTVQVPRPTSSGDILVPILLPAGDRIASILRWVEGSTVWDEDDDSKSDYRPETMRRLGSMMARLHNHSESWKRPHDFIRRYAESDDTERTMEDLYPEASTGRLSGGDFFQIESVINAIDDHLRKIERSSASRGLIHGDLTGRNCVLGVDFRPIDFDWCSIGWYLYDIGWVFGIADLSREGRQAWLDGYADLRPLPGHALRTIEAFVIETRLRYASWHAGSDSFGKIRLHDFLWNECARFLSGHPFLLEDDEDASPFFIPIGAAL